LPITRSFANGFEVVDYTSELLIVPSQYGLIAELGLFNAEPVSGNTVVFEKVEKDGALIVDRVRGERAQVNKDYVRKIHSFAVPHFPYDEAILPQDIQGKRAYGDFSREDTLAEVRARKMERIRQNHAWTLEYARAKAITTGDVYAPSGTVSQNWYTEFGITQKSVDFVLGTATTEVLEKQEEVVAHIQDNLGNGGNISGIIALCSPEFFAKLIKHPNVKLAYQYYTSTQEPLRRRLAADGVRSLRREFTHGDVTYIEMRDTYAGNRLIPAGEVYYVPTGVEDMFKTFFGPANKFGIENTLGEQAYMFEYPSIKGDKIEIETESNFVNMVTRPQGVVKGISSN
jgi:hypothetical protein